MENTSCPLPIRTHTHRARSWHTTHVLPRIPGEGGQDSGLIARVSLRVHDYLPQGVDRVRGGQAQDQPGCARRLLPGLVCPQRRLQHCQQAGACRLPALALRCCGVGGRVSGWAGGRVGGLWYTCGCVHVCVHARTCMCVCACVFVCVCVFVFPHLPTHAHTRPHKHTRTTEVECNQS